MNWCNKKKIGPYRERECERMTTVDDDGWRRTHLEDKEQLIILTDDLLELDNVGVVQLFQTLWGVQRGNGRRAQGAR